MDINEISKQIVNIVLATLRNDWYLEDSNWNPGASMKEVKADITYAVADYLEEVL